MDCGCSDPWICRCRPEEPLTDHAVDGYADTARYIAATTGCTPILPVDVLRAMFGDDSQVTSLMCSKRLAGIDETPGLTITLEAA